MSLESTASASEWTRAPELAGLYVLRVDGISTPHTSLVDRGQPRSEQVNELAKLDWPPPQQLTAVYDATVKAKMPAPKQFPSVSERYVSPLLGGLAVVIDREEEPSAHPIRRYLFPDTDASGILALDEGETRLLIWKSSTPKLYSFHGDDRLPSWMVPSTGPVRGWGDDCADDGGIVSSPTSVPTELADGVGILTSKRLVFLGHLRFPSERREDHSFKLGLISPTLDDLRATFRQTKRWHNRPHLSWGFHVRHEWVNQFGEGHVTDRKKPLFGNAPSSDFITTGFRYLSGNFAQFQIPYRQLQPTRQAVASMYREALAADQAQATVTGPEVQTRQESVYGFRTTKETAETTTWRVEGTVPYSLPASFTPRPLSVAAALQEQTS